VQHVGQSALIYAFKSTFDESSDEHVFDIINCICRKLFVTHLSAKPHGNAKQAERQRRKFGEKKCVCVLAQMICKLTQQISGSDGTTRLRRQLADRRGASSLKATKWIIQVLKSYTNPPVDLFALHI
jgi:hypothetical protein